jgi:hypothetical protein
LLVAVHLHRVVQPVFCRRKHSAAKVEGRKGVMRATLYSCCQANKKTISRMLMIIKKFQNENSMMVLRGHPIKSLF